jgi:tetratricopeptide (TPR) repeat protein
MNTKQSSLTWFLAIGCLSPFVAYAQAGGGEHRERYAAEGRQALVAGQFDTARADFEHLEKLDPGVAEIHANLAVIYFELREYERAVTEIRTAQKLKPGLPKLDSLLGMSLSEMGKFTEALPQLEKGFKQSSDTELRRMCGLQLLRAYVGLGRNDDAVETSLKLNKFYPDDPEVLYHTGKVYGSFAYGVMEKLRDIAPGSIWMLQAQGEANESQKNFEAAIIAYDHVLQIEPGRPGIHYRLGRVYLTRYREVGKQEDWDAAQREYTAELAIDASNGNAGYELANMKADVGNFEEARKGFEQVVERFPDFEEALVGLGAVVMKLGEPQLALLPLERATRLSPEDEVAWYRLSQAERALGNKDAQQKAMEVFRKLHRSTPGTLRKPAQDEELTPQKIDGNP